MAALPACSASSAGRASYSGAAENRMPPHAPLNLSDLPPDALDDVAAHLPPHALSRLLRCCRKLNEALAAKPQPALEELDMRHLRCKLTRNPRLLAMCGSLSF